MFYAKKSDPKTQRPGQKQSSNFEGWSIITHYDKGMMY